LATDTGRGILRACDLAALNYVGALATVTVFPDASGGLPRRRGGIRRPSPLSAMFFVQLAETAAEAERLRAVIAACYGLAPHDAADHHSSWSAFPVPLGLPRGRGGGPQASRRDGCRHLR